MMFVLLLLIMKRPAQNNKLNAAAFSFACAPRALQPCVSALIFLKFLTL